MHNAYLKRGVKLRVNKVDGYAVIKGDFLVFIQDIPFPSALNNGDGEAHPLAEVVYSVFGRSG